MHCGIRLSKARRFAKQSKHIPPRHPALPLARLIRHGIEMGQRALRAHLTRLPQLVNPRGAKAAKAGHMLRVCAQARKPRAEGASGTLKQVLRCDACLSVPRPFNPPHFSPGFELNAVIAGDSSYAS